MCLEKSEMSFLADKKHYRRHDKEIIISWIDNQKKYCCQKKKNKWLDEGNAHFPAKNVILHLIGQIGGTGHKATAD